MKIPTPAVSGLACAGLVMLALASSSALAGVQWKWRDASGAIQYSDRPPPAGTPESAILSRPTPTARAVVRPVDAASAASAPAAPGASAKAIDAELDAKRKKADEEKQARQKVEDEKQAKVRAENCDRARSYERSLKDGMRIARTNAKGEREFLDDQTRAEELQRTQEAIQSNCGK
ncbi:MAG: DUF4124 domain-containing protein [Proteobacteria bacterium]|uniref:DUF4124 domain-containing protein n=1 Tax=Aquabacterium sp. TaxID=1872578 RepID=UPI0035C6693E|nr:DUF4124 domain-containing protein [Pseudomonadota bacterium]